MSGNPYDQLPEPTEAPPPAKGKAAKRAAAPSAPEAAAATAVAGGTRASKRRREEAEPAKSKSPSESPSARGSGSGGNAAGAGFVEDEDTLEKLDAVIAKLASVIRGDNEHKYAKATDIIRKLVLSDLTAETASRFVPLLAAVQVPASRTRTDVTRPYVFRLFQDVRQRRDAFGDMDSDLQYEVDTWLLRCFNHNGMITDDTYVFARHVKPLQEALIALEADAKKRPEAAITERRAVILDMLEALLPFLKYSWAKVPIDEAFKEATDRRALFLDAERERLDEVYAKVKTSRALAAKGKGAPGMPGAWKNWST